jgi:hypothetical protein
VKLYFDIVSRIDSLLKKRDLIKAMSAHPRVMESLDKNTGIIFGRYLQETFGLIVQFASIDSTAYRKARCENYNLKVRLKKNRFFAKIVSCLPAGAPAVSAECQ